MRTILSLVPRPHPAHARRRGLVSQVGMLGPSSRNEKQPMKSQSSVYWNNAEARTSTSIVTAQSDVMKFIIHTGKFVILH